MASVGENGGETHRRHHAQPASDGVVDGLEVHVRGTAVDGQAGGGARRGEHTIDGIGGGGGVLGLEDGAQPRPEAAHLVEIGRPGIGQAVSPLATVLAQEVGQVVRRCQVLVA